MTITVTSTALARVVLALAMVVIQPAEVNHPAAAQRATTEIHPGAAVAPLAAVAPPVVEARLTAADLVVVVVPLAAEVHRTVKAHLLAMVQATPTDPMTVDAVATRTMAAATGAKGEAPEKVTVRTTTSSSRATEPV